MTFPGSFLDTTLLFMFVAQRKCLQGRFSAAADMSRIEVLCWALENYLGICSVCFRTENAKM